MAVNSNVGFKLGTQSAVDNIIKNKSSVAVGSFYLTSDTHRLYIGETDGLHPVNEGVITVDSINDLPDVSTNKDAYAGRFYYIKNDNILCVFNGSVWAQINSDTYVKKSEFVMVKLEGGNVVEIDGNIYNYTAGNQSSVSNAPFQIEGANGILASVSTEERTVGQEKINVHRITLTGDTYTLSTSASGTGAKINLDSSNTDNDSAVELVPGIAETESATNVTMTVDPDTKKITLAVKDTTNKTFASGYGESNEGFKLTLTDTYNKALSALINPIVEFGVDTKETATFKSGTVALDVYSKTEIQKKLKALNAMTYRGTLGKQGTTSGTAGTNIAVTGTAPNFDYKVMNNGTEVKVSIGDTFLVIGSDSISLNNGVSTLSNGTLLIVRGGTEDADGYVTDIVFDIVESTVDHDTTYHFEGVPTTDVTATEGAGGILLRDETNSSIQGKFIVQGGTATDGAAINITRQTDKLATNGYKETLTIKHGTVARTDSELDDAEMTPTADNFGASVTIPVVVGVTTDKTGHVTGLSTQDYVIKDTNAKMGKNVYDTTIYSKDDGTNVGVIKATVGVKSQFNAINEMSGSMTLNSKSLTITNNDSSGATKGGDAVAGLSIEMIWGEFK